MHTLYLAQLLTGQQYNSLHTLVLLSDGAHIGAKTFQAKQLCLPFLSKIDKNALAVLGGGSVPEVHVGHIHSRSSHQRVLSLGGTSLGAVSLDKIGFGILC